MGRITPTCSARLPARLLKADFLPTVWIPEERERYVRELLAHRARLGRTRTAVINELHAVYAKRNIEVPEPKFNRRRFCAPKRAD